MTVRAMAPRPGQQADLITSNLRLEAFDHLRSRVGWEWLQRGPSDGCDCPKKSFANVSTSTARYPTYASDPDVALFVAVSRARDNRYPNETMIFD